MTIREGLQAAFFVPSWVGGDVPADVIEALAAILGPAQVLTAPADVAPYVTDWRERYHGKALCVVRPANTEQVAAVVRLCAERRIPVVPQGGNTGLCGAATPDGSGRAVVVRLDRMNRVRSLSRTGGSIVVDAGCVLAAIQQAADEAGMLFPLSLGAEGSCQIGGNISTNAGGVTVMRYGPMRELVLGLEVVLPDGSIADWLAPLRKNTTGYDLKQLFIGAEGTLGLITGAALKLFPKPAQSAVAMAVHTEIEDALRLLERCRARLGDRLTSFEIISRSQVQVVLDHAQGCSDPFDKPWPWYLLIEATDTLPGGGLRPALEETLAAALEEGVIADAVIPASEAQAAALWRIRHSVSEANKDAGMGVSHDTAVPLENQARFVRAVTAQVEAEFPGANVLMIGHIGDGNIHAVILLDFARYEGDAFWPAAARINDIVDGVTLSLGGTISAEHGIGQTNKRRLLAGRGAADVALMRSIKAALDPHGLMNPGKLFDLPATAG